MKKFQLLSASIMMLAAASQADTYALKSPNSRVQVDITNNGGGLSYTLSLDGKQIISESSLGLIINNKPLGNNEMQFLSKENSSVNESFNLLGRTKTVADHYNTYTLKFAAKDERKLNLNLIVRAYDEGVAIRYQLPNQSGLDQFTIQNELTQFIFANDYNCFGFNQGKFVHSHEGEFDPVKSSMIRQHNLYDNPLVCKTGVGQTTFALAESDVRDYPGSWFTGTGGGANGVETRLTYSVDNLPDGSNYASVRAKMSAKGFNTPWRVVMLGDNPGKLAESSLIAALGEPTQIKDTSWIKPGKTAWDWWNDNQVVFGKGATASKPGMNTDTYKAYIDFAATLGLQYILIDEGWHKGSTITSKPGSDLLTPVPAMDMPAILSYAKSKNVGVWVWLQWKQLDWQMAEALEAYEKWGIKGIKVDFMDRSDQEMVDYFHKLLTMTAKHHIMVDLHGAYPPNGLVRTYPHYLTQEGVLGAEYNKWSSRVTATHNVTLPFTRMILGPIDYTPGGFLHATPEEFPKLRRNTLPYVKTTRGQALAMYVVYDSPLQMLADSPINYSKTEGAWPKPKSDWADGLEFIKDVPTTWDETRILQGDIGQYIVSARRKGKDWYIGAMTNEEGRALNIPLNFLDKGKYKAQIWQDGKTISSLNKTETTQSNADSLTLTLAPSGGAVVLLKK
ncbi:alpha-glucosidase [Cellvibrio zantedeschiae]|uniref:Alpha-glucosidase n=1 Tax=Cellvibrio zantedeschiae TaxID=1237077 RepID=A0ABQ3B5E2_9GAMM|nr:glycoside hydrolase family 97 protein [Cellvibrio zantedeschiae]GGY73995.1 alpha-glucosidase [Cellvibrio zantedeschiae]